MLTRGLFLGLDESNLRDLRSAKRNKDKAALIGTWEEDWAGTGQTQDTDKAWKLLFYVLREPVFLKPAIRKQIGADFNMNWLAQLVSVGRELFYGPNFYNADWCLMTHVDRQKLPFLNLHLQNIDQAKFEKKCERCANYLFKQHEFSYDDKALRYLLKWNSKISNFAKKAEENDWHLVFSADNC